MTERETPQQGGLSRRDMLKRSAVVGGALVWTTPAVQSLAGPAFASEATVQFDESSYVAMVVEDSDGNKLRVKWENDNGGGSWEPSPGEPPGQMECKGQVEHWKDAEDADGGDLGIGDTVSGGVVTFSFPAGIAFLDGRAKDGTDTCSPAISSNPTSQASFRIE